MATVYFLGAGASAADGIPVTAQLNYGIAAWLRRSGKRANHLWTYYRDLYGVKPREIDKAARRWRRFLAERNLDLLAEPCTLPSLIETLSLVDVCVSEGQSLGVSSMRKRRIPVDINVDFLRVVRQQLTFAIGSAVEEATNGRQARYTSLLATHLRAKEDTIVSTNWDMLVDYRIVDAKAKLNGRWLVESPIKYHCVGEQPVNWRGSGLAPARSPHALLRLHGALNWFGCASCGVVYVNLEGSYIMGQSARRAEHDDCECGAGLLTVMVAPSYIKDYRSVSLRSVWQVAQKRLEKARRWIFIGYSLPSDDFHIRAMLMRALCARARKSARPKRTDIQVFLAADGAAAAARYRDFFRISEPRIRMTGFEGWAKQPARRR